MRGASDPIKDSRTESAKTFEMSDMARRSKPRSANATTERMQPRWSSTRIMSALDVVDQFGQAKIRDSVGLVHCTSYSTTWGRDPCAALNILQVFEYQRTTLDSTRPAYLSRQQTLTTRRPASGPPIPGRSISSLHQRGHSLWDAVNSRTHPRARYSTSCAAVRGRCGT